jgi:hypothetical protein
MGESIKAVFAFLLIVSIPAGLLAWFLDDPGATAWGFRIGSPLLAVMAVAALLLLHLRRDAAPDFLHALAKTFYNIDGFCFAVRLDVHDGTCRLLAYFQNQYAGACTGHIELAPLPGFFLTAAKVDLIHFEIPCEGGAFGVAIQPIAVPQVAQNKSQIFNVAALADYPNGKGQRLRFRDGRFLRANTPKGRSVDRAIRLALATSGSLWYFLHRPPRVKLRLPKGVAEELSLPNETRVKTLWKPGDPPIDPQAPVY